jgi:hypothetical protein
MPNPPTDRALPPRASMILTAALALAAACAAPLAEADSTIVSPGSEAAKQAEKSSEDVAAQKKEKARQSTYEMEQVLIEGQPLPQYKDDELIGEYKQPRWTAQRLFSGTRTYVIPKGEVDVEQWYRFETPHGGGPTTVTAQTELEIGMPHRLQLDMYLTNKHDTGTSDSSTGNSFEIRWAFADWGRLWGNPALYVEYTTMSGDPDLVETKLLLGDQLAPGWHWGINFSVEQQTSGDRTTEKQFTAGLSHSLIDHVLEVGLETRLGWTDARGSRGHYERDTQVGPTIRWRPMRQMHVDFAPLFGTTKDSMRVNSYVIVGWEF